MTIPGNRAGMLFGLLILGILSTGCGPGGARGGRTMVVEELGISMNIPAGWNLDGPQLCTKGNSTGLMMEEEVNPPSFEATAAALSREFGASVTSETSFDVNGNKAIKTLGKTADGNVLLRVYVESGTKLALISFVIAKDEYQTYASHLQESIDSIRISE